MTDKQNEVLVNNSKKLNGFTITAIVMAAMGFWINPFCILSTIGIVFGGIGIAKSISSRDKTWAIISLGLSIMETLFWLVTFSNELAAL
ncbi:hypothetical protein LH991_14120 [Schleiferilactobacillus harbinensis]|uniref:hypothetical protein n=1 Tax=Schleiferilactobacillus harbinensis TaxID=304207 RepID=UPI0004800193|nr:hypothetical protein [Schleiferilactobacillus harbinensis]QFR65000.1 hypothetical protein LH991_14120 [Schleiferilactobacillus harbinensis]